MSVHFDKAKGIVKEIETVYVNDPNDTGGETVWGFSRNNFPNHYIWQLVDNAKKTMSHPEFINYLNTDTNITKLVDMWYKETFWDVFGLDNISDYGICFEIFEQAVNTYTVHTTKHIQRVFNVLNVNNRIGTNLVVDGKIGPATRAALVQIDKSTHVTAFRNGINCLQGLRYIELAENNPSKYQRYVSGWLAKRI